MQHKKYTCSFKKIKRKEVGGWCSGGSAVTQRRKTAGSYIQGPKPYIESITISSSDREGAMVKGHEALLQRGGSVERRRYVIGQRQAVWTDRRPGVGEGERHAGCVGAVVRVVAHRLWRNVNYPTTTSPERMRTLCQGMQETFLVMHGLQGSL